MDSGPNALPAVSVMGLQHSAEVSLKHQGTKQASVRRSLLSWETWRGQLAPSQPLAASPMWRRAPGSSMPPCEGNITFGKPFDQARYDAVVEATSLEHDFKVHAPAHHSSVRREASCSAVVMQALENKKLW